ncbi:TIGR04076 family protein [Desulfotignum balticum]|uniref:TIGR04076 family protein n=1 Tax=Desulfotignum balticum TaxID=115781 RepID=UPI000A01E31C|nr:TIGR04076 family protein [Desulfotignum balticum]
MQIEPDKRVKINIVHSECDIMKVGDSIYLQGSVLDVKKSCPFCVTALLSIYPWVMSARFGIESKQLGWKNGYRLYCPDKLVEFEITFYD